MTSAQVGTCQWCGGRGWKFVSIRRSLDIISPISESASVHQRRENCLGCAGTGSANA